MRRTTIAAIMTAVMVLAITPAALAGGPTATDAQERGYTCFAAGPDNWAHCLRAEQIGNKLVKVRIFTEAVFDEETGLILSGGDEYLGSEDLVRANAYDGRPCTEDNLEVWDGPLGPDLDGDGQGDYFACHRFDTGRN